MLGKNLDQDQNEQTPAHRAWLERVADENPYLVTRATTDILGTYKSLHEIETQLHRLYPSSRSSLLIFKQVIVDDKLSLQEDDLFLVVSNSNHVLIVTDRVDLLIEGFPRSKRRWPYIRAYRKISGSDMVSKWVKKQEEQAQATRAKEHAERLRRQELQRKQNEEDEEDEESEN